MQLLLLFLIENIVGFFMLLWTALVTQKLWAWFMVPQFELAPLSIFMAIGIGLLISHLFRSISLANIEKEQEDMWKTFFMKNFLHFFGALMTLIWGAIIHSWL